MAATTAQKTPSNATAAEFRAWAAFVNSALAAGAMTKTTDTGQIDLTTVAAPGAANTSMGYEIWQSNDSGTRFYVKIEYGSGAAAASPGIWITVGWATDGAGNLSQISTRKQIVSGGNQTTGNTMICSGGVGTGRAIIALFTLGGVGAGSSYAIWFSVERTRDGAGAENATEIMVMGGAQSTPSFSQVVPSSGAVPTQEALVPMVVPTIANAVYGGLVGVGLMFGQKGGLTNPSSQAFTYPTAQITQGGQVSMDAYGATHNYLALGTQPPVATSSGLLMRFD